MSQFGSQMSRSTSSVPISAQASMMTRPSSARRPSPNLSTLRTSSGSASSNRGLTPLSGLKRSTTRPASASLSGHQQLDTNSLYRSQAHAQTVEDIPGGQQPVSNSAKLLVLSGKVNDMDKDIENQSIVRRQRDFKIETLQSELTMSTNTVKSTVTRVEFLEDRMGRLERLAQAEKEQREEGEKAIYALIDERFKTLGHDQSNFKLDTDTRITQLQQRQALADERTETIANQVTTAKDVLWNVETFANKLNDKVNALQSVIQAESVKRAEDIQKAFKGLQHTVGVLQGEFDASKSVNDRNIAEMRAIFAAEKEDLRRVVEKENANVANALKKGLAKFTEDCAALRRDLVNEARERELADGNTMAQAVEVCREIAAGIEENNNKKQDEFLTKFRGFEDTMWKLQFSLDKEVETRTSSDKNVHKALTEEAHDREALGRSLTQVLESTVAKLQSGMEPYFNKFD